jgi:hypothetical protein
VTAQLGQKPIWHWLAFAALDHQAVSVKHSFQTDNLSQHTLSLSAQDIVAGQISHFPPFRRENRPGEAPDVR